MTQVALRVTSRGNALVNEWWETLMIQRVTTIRLLGSTGQAIVCS
jgi:hypothetical protein